MTMSSAGRSIPPIKEYALSNTFMEYQGINNSIFLEALQYAEKPVASFPFGRRFLDIWWGEMWPIWEQEQPVEPLLENVQRRAEAELGF